MVEEIASSSFFLRFLDICIPILTWILITLPLWLSPFHPAVVAYFIIAFDLYFFYKSYFTVYYAVVSYKTILVYQRVSFRRKVLAITNSASLHHFIIIPTYEEPLHKLESTINALTKSDYPYKKLHLVLAFEEREVEAKQKAEELTNKFSGNFAKIIVTDHPLLANEVAGKASNQTYAAKYVDAYVSTNHIRREKVLITICDADSHLPKNYFSYLSYTYLKDKDHLYHFYWAPVLLYNNFWQLPFFVRMQATLSSILRLAFLSQKNRLIQISTYSTNLWLLKNINFWDVDIIPEDWHVYFQAFFKYGEIIKTLPLYTLVNGDAVYSGNIIKTLVNRYEQEKRWAWGVSDIGFVLKEFVASEKVDSWAKLKKILFLAETHLLWPISFFILTISALIPPLINPVFKRTVLGFLLPKLSSLILTLSTSALLIYIYLDVKLRNKLSQKTKLRSLPLLLIQWYLLPVVSFILSSLPALDAHTRMIFGKKLKYKVTEKI